MVSLYDIHKVVAEFHEVEMDFVFQESRKKDVVELRQIFHYLAKELNPMMSYATIGAYGLPRDHATVMFSHRNIKNLMEVELPMRNKVETIHKACLQLKVPVPKSHLYAFHRRKFKLISELNETTSMKEMDEVLRKNIK